MSLDERKEIIDDFEKNNKFICSCKTISEGVDVPFVDGAVFWINKSS